MQLAEQFAATYTPQFFSDMFFENANIPKFEFVVVEQPEVNSYFDDLDDDSGFVARAETPVQSFSEESSTNLMHLKPDNLKKWKGVEMVGAPAEQQWKTCINYLRVEAPKKNPDKCPKWNIQYNLTCSDEFDEEVFDYVPICRYCVQFYNWTEPICTDPCENATSYTNEFNEVVYDLRCTDPHYQSKLDKRVTPTAPPALRIVFQIISSIFELHVIAIAIGPWYILSLVYQFVDFLIDWLWYGIFFAWCLPCAWVFIWIFNVAFLPIQVWNYVNRFQLELIGFVFDWWLMIFNGDTCFLRWGNYCWQARTMGQRDHMTYMDNVAMTRLPDLADEIGWNHGQSMMDWIGMSLKPPSVDEFRSDDWLAVGKAKREMMTDTCPGMAATQQFFKDLADKIQAKTNQFSSALAF